MLKLVRNKHTNRSHTHLDRPRGQAGLQAHPRYRRGRGLNRRYTIIRYHTPSCPAPRQPRPAPGCGRPAQADPHAHQPPSGNSQKTAKSASPHLASHTLQPMSRRSPCASDPHTGHVSIRFCGSLARTLACIYSCVRFGGITHNLYTGHVSIRFCGSPIRPASSKKSGTNSAETSVSGPANQASAGLHEFPASTAGAVPHARTGRQIRRDQRPVFRGSTLQPRSLKFPAPTTGGHGRLRRRCVGVNVWRTNACLR